MDIASVNGSRAVDDTACRAGRSTNLVGTLGLMSHCRARHARWRHSCSRDECKGKKCWKAAGRWLRDTTQTT